MRYSDLTGHHPAVLGVAASLAVAFAVGAAWDAGRQLVYILSDPDKSFAKDFSVTSVLKSGAIAVGVTAGGMIAVAIAPAAAPLILVGMVIGGAIVVGFVTQAMNF